MKRKRSWKTLVINMSGAVSMKMYVVDSGLLDLILGQLKMTENSEYASLLGISTFGFLALGYFLSSCIVKFLNFKVSNRPLRIGIKIMLPVLYLLGPIILLFIII